MRNPIPGTLYMYDIYIW